MRRFGIAMCAALLAAGVAGGIVAGAGPRGIGLFEGECGLTDKEWAAA